MTQEIVFRQASKGYCRAFTLGRDNLLCIVRDTSGRNEFSVPYEAIDIEATSSLTINRTPLCRWLFRTYIVLFVTGFAASAAGLPDAVHYGLIALGFLVAIPVIANPWTKWLSASFTLMRLSPPPPGNNSSLLILHDGQQDAVIAAIRQAKQARLIDQTHYNQQMAILDAEPSPLIN